MSEWLPIIGIVSILLNSLAALFWGAKTISAKTAHIDTLKEQVAALTSTADEIVKAKNAQLDVVELQLRELRDLSPKTLKEYVVHIKEMLEGYNESLKNELEFAQTKNEELKHEIEVERDQSARITAETNKLRTHIEDLQRTYLRNQEAITAMEGLKAESNGEQRKGVFIGAYIPEELRESLKRNASFGKRTLSQEIVGALYNSILRQTLSPWSPDYLEMKPEDYVRHLETQRVVMNLSRSQREALTNGMKNGTETHESVLRKMESWKDQKLQDSLSRIAKILGGSEPENERIKRAKAVAIDNLLVPTF